MLPILVLWLVTIYSGQAALLQCDFEILCDDFTIDYNWGFTDGLHPRPIDHDHTLNNSSGHYLFYQPQNGSRPILAEIKTTNWTQPITDRAVCFQMWYYTPSLSLPFSIQLVQGDDEQLTRIVASIPGKDPSINDWTQVKVTLPAEKLKIFIRSNSSVGPLAFDDLSVDYCDEPRPSPPETIFACDFESSCSEDFISLPEYPYQWSTIQASEAPKQEGQAPSVDYTFGNGSGHYIWLPTYKLTQPGNVGYLATKAALNITANESYCLDFQYYGYGRSSTGNLRVYSWLQEAPHTVQMLWPLRGSSQYVYTSNQWTWGIINLPVGQYSLLFRVDNSDLVPRSFALDNVDIISCDYPPSELTPYDSFLSFSCDFDNLTMCDMINGDRFSVPSFNFTLITGETIPNRKLGPTRDHTTNSSSGGFLYWDRQLPYVPWNNGRVRTPKSIEQNLGMCIRFAYYVKSLAVNKNATMLAISVGGCYGMSIWTKAIDDSQGWQVTIAPVKGYACGETFYFDVNQKEPIEVSVAFDDIEVDQCSTLNPTTTTTTTTTITTTIASTSTATSTSTTSSSTTQSTTTKPMITSTTTSTSTLSSLSPSTTPRSNAQQLLSTNGLFLLALYFYLAFSENIFLNKIRC